MTVARPAATQAQRGIAMIEALVGILIFAFGVLGLVGLQASMTKAQTTSKLRADAANLASDLFALIQTDHASRLSLYTDANCKGYARCADWQRRVAKGLPSGQFELSSDAATGRVTLSISWMQGGGDRNKYNTSMVWQQ